MCNIALKMTWQQLQNGIYYVDGSLRDIYVRQTIKDDWLVWADFVNQNYQISFYTCGEDIKQDKINIYKVFEHWDCINKNLSTATIFIDNIKINVHFFSEQEIENDIAPTEVRSLNDHVKLVDYMVKVSGALNKKVVLSPENSPEIELIAIYHKVVTVNAL
jgi:hypothetical protein